MIDYEDDEFFEDEEFADSEEVVEEIPEKVKKSQAWRNIEAIREERALQKKLAREYDLEALEDWYFDDDEL